MKYNDNGIWKDLTVKVSDTLPIGTVIPFAGNTVPSDWMVCDGSAISRTVYSTLFGVIGTSFGEGDGETTFNIPDLRGKVVVGVDSEDTDFDTLGETGGEKTHTLTIDEIPSHNHRFNLQLNSTQNLSGNYGKYGVQGHDDTVIKNAGGGQSHNNLQPYQVVNYIIKATKTVTGDYISETLPIGTELEFNGETTDIPTGWTQVSEKAKILWTNEDPTSNFASQAITLDESLANYDMYEIAFKASTSVNEYITSGRIKTGYGGNVYQGWTTGSGVSGRTRTFQYTSDITITFGNGSNGNSTTANGNCIPLYVIGYVTNLFEEEE